MTLLSNASIAGRLARLPLRFVPPELPVRVLTGPLRGRRWIPASGTHGCWLGWFERLEQQWFVALLGPGMVLYDIGACVGFYTLLGATLTGASGRVVAFEPLPRNLEYLRRHLELNALTQVRVVPAAVADYAGSAFISSDASPFQNALRSDGTGLRVDAVSIDDVARTERPPDLMKIDVEGAEASVLEGANETLERSRPHVLLSIHTEEARRRSLAILRQHGYTCAPMDPRHSPERAAEWHAAPPA